MVFSFLKKIFGGSDDAQAAPAVEQQDVEPAAKQPREPRRNHKGRNDERSAERQNRRSQGRSKRDPNVRREPLTPHQEYHDAPSNLSPEQQKEVIDKLEFFVQHVAKSLVAFPDQISTEIVPKDNQKVILISCAKGDAGKLIGRSGKIISAIRVLVSGNAARNNLRVTVDIKD